MRPTGHVVVISHPRSGTHLTIDSISNNFREWNRPYLNIDRLRETHQSPLSLSDVTAQLADAPHVIKTHSHIDVFRFFLGNQEHATFVGDLLESSTLIYVHRDGRDVMVSLYYYVQAYRSELSDSSFSEFLRMPNDQDSDTYAGEITRPGYWARHVSGWLEDKRVSLIPFESLRENYDPAVRHIAAALNRKTPDRIVPVIRTGSVDIRDRAGVWKNRLQRIALRYGRGIRSTAVGFRSGLSGDHKTHFSDLDRAYFDEWAGQALTRLGYEHGRS